jgi:hypothetical protein
MKYGQMVREFSEAYDLGKSAVSEHFIGASRVKLKELMERRLDTMRLCRADNRRQTIRGAADDRSLGRRPPPAENDSGLSARGTRMRRQWASCRAT